MFSDNPCSTGNRRGVSVRKQCDQSRMTAHARGGCSWYANRGRCSRRERCYPRVIVSEYLVKSNNAINMRTHRCSCRRKLRFLGLTPDLDKGYSCKCRCCHSICGYSCVRHKSKQVRKGTCVRSNLSEEAIADLWNVKRVWNTSHSVKSQDNEICGSFKKKNIGRFREKSTNIEKLVHEETTSSSYVDAKNCFVQDVCIQTVCQSHEETKGFPNRCKIEDNEISDLTKDKSFAFHKRCETEMEDKFEQTSLNCDCDLPSVVKSTKSVSESENLSCLEEGEKLNNNIKCTCTSSTCTCVPHVPELQLERKYDCLPAFNYKYQYVKQPYEENEVETLSRLTKDQEVVPNECRRRRLYSVRNRNSELTCPSVCECNRYTPNLTRSSTSTESTIHPTKTWITRNNRDRENVTFMEKSEQIGEGPWSRNETAILRKQTVPLINKIDNRENYNTRNDCNLLTCHCGDMSIKVISDDKSEDTETSLSRTTSSSTSLSSHDCDRSPQSFPRYISYRCRNLASVPSSASTCSESLTSEIEYGCVKECPKTLNPLSLTSTITYGNNRNGRFNITKLSCHRTLSVMRRQSKKIRERTRNSLYD